MPQVGGYRPPQRHDSAGVHDYDLDESRNLQSRPPVALMVRRKQRKQQAQAHEQREVPGLTHEHEDDVADEGTHAQS